jgi:hypothetical protein
MWAWIRDAWQERRDEIVRVVLGGLGGITRLPQLPARRAILDTGRGTCRGRCSIPVRDLAHASLSAGEGKRAMDADDRDEIDISDWFLSAVAAEDEALAIWIDKVCLCVTVHEEELLLQIILEESDARELLRNDKSMRLIEYAATIVHDDMECHVTWAEKKKKGRKK